MRVVTWNVNGFRSALRKGILERIHALQPDALMLQEVRATYGQIETHIRECTGWHVEWHAAQRPGYSGTAVFSRFYPRTTTRGLGRNARFPDHEGRVLTTDLGGVVLACVYLPSGSSGAHRQAVKDDWLPRFTQWADALARKRTPVLIGGDLNVAHTERDIYHWRSNQKSSGFLPHERRWFGQLLDRGWHDLIREHHGDTDGPYSWWSNRGRARELDRGWRIDHMLANRAARRLVRGSWIDRDAADGISDHAPVVVDIDASVRQPPVQPASDGPDAD